MAAAAAPSSTASGASFSDLPSTMISYLGPFLGRTVTSRDVRALACVNKKASVAVQRMPVIGLRISKESTQAEMPDGTVCLSEEQAVARAKTASRVLQTIELTGFGTHEGVAAILRSCERLHTLSVESEAVLDWSQDDDDRPLSASLRTLHLRSCFSLFHLHLMLQKLPGLQSLSISNCPDLTQDDFESMPSSQLAELHTLRLTNCAGVTDLAAAELAKRLGPSLKKFSVAGCANITSAGVGHVLARTPALESLDLCNCARVDSSVCDTVAGAGVAKTLRLLRFPARVLDADALRLVTAAAPAAAAGAAEVASAAASATTGLVRLRHLGLTGSGIGDAALGTMLSHLPELHTLDLQMCACLSFRVIDVLIANAKALQRIDVRGQRRLRADDIEKLIKGIPSLVLVVGEASMLDNARLQATAGARSVVLRSKPGLAAE